MKIYPIDPKVRAFWKVFPLRITDGSDCDDCGEETLLVQSLDGGFVTRTCPKCTKPARLPRSVFLNLNLWIACPKCKERMEAEMIRYNYGYVCKNCDIGVPLHELLPRWEDL